MHFEINVVLNGRHFFATDKRSLLTAEVCRRVYDTFVTKFPTEEGYELSIVQHVDNAVIISASDLPHNERPDCSCYMCRTTRENRVALERIDAHIAKKGGPRRGKLHVTR